MTNRIFAAVCALLFISAVAVFLFSMPNSINGDAAQTSLSVNAEDTDTKYTVKAWNGSIGIFENGSAEPVRTIPVDPASLPDEAQSLLQKGITVSGHSELLLLIEDYIS